MNLLGYGTLVAAALLFYGASARSLSYRMKATESKACFFANVDNRVNLSTALLQFYFVVFEAKTYKEGLLDVFVTGPSGQQLYQLAGQKRGEINIKPPQTGDYSICFHHNGTPHDKNIDLDIVVPNVPADNSSQSRDSSSTKLDNTVQKLQKDLGDLVHTLRYIKNREKRNLETVETIDEWIFYLSFFEVALIIGMSILQVTILRMFFTRAVLKWVNNMPDLHFDQGCSAGTPKMVLEGLRLADDLLTVLRKLGLTQDIRAENLDQEFASRQYGAALGSLLQSLHTRTLTNAEIKRLEYFDGIGLLDGLVDDLDREENQEEVTPEHLAGRENELIEDCQMLEKMLEEKRLELDLLDNSVSDSPIQAPLIPSESFKISELQSIQTRPLAEKLKEILKNNAGIKVNLEECVQKSRDTFLLAQGVHAFQTVKIDNLFVNNWDPNLWDIYKTAIIKGIALLGRSGIDLSLEELLAGEALLGRIRAELIGELDSRVVELAHERLSLNRAFLCALKTLYKETDKYEQILKDVQSNLAEFARLLGNIRPAEVHQRPKYTSVTPAAENASIIRIIERSLKEAKDMCSNLDRCFGKLLEHQGTPPVAEVHVLPPDIRNSEQVLRSKALVASNDLQSLSTESTCLKLCSTPMQPKPLP